jgi:DnaJ family protein A protein 2
MVMQQQAHCDECRGKGEIIDPKHKCKKCKASKVLKERKVIEV